MDRPWRIELLGGLRAVRGEQIVTRFQTQQTGLLLAYMAYYRQRSHPREALIELLWPGCEPRAGRHRLSMALSALRAQLALDGEPAGMVIMADRGSVRLNPAAVTTDVGEFKIALRAAQRAGSGGERASSLAQAVARYRGELLPGFFEDWVLQERSWLVELYFQALGQLIAHLQQEGELPRALAYAQRGVRADPLREEAHSQLMRLYAAVGQPAAALRQYQELERLLQEQLEATPAAPTRALLREIERLSVLRPQAATVPRLSPPHPDEAAGAPLSTVAEGENRLVTVLFADMSRSVETTQDLDPEEAALINRLLGVMVDVTLKYEGRVDRFLGDGVLAVFGMLQTHEDDPGSAIRAALEIREAARKLGLEVTAGINTGEVYRGAVGTERHREVTVVGPVVNLAARLQEQAEPGQVLVGEATYRQSRRAFAFSSRSLAIKGISQPVLAYTVDQALPRPEKARGIEGLRAELIGREEELTRLRHALTELLQGRGQVVSLIGEAGIGKSRLVSELKAVARSAAAADGRQPFWLEGRCLELGMTTSYSLFVDLFREYFAWQPEEDDHRRVERIRAALQELVDRGDLPAERAEEMGPLIGNLLALRSGSDWDVRLKNASPEQIKHQTFLAVRDLFLALAQRQPLALVLEDLHWADSLSLDLISLLMEIVTRAPVCLLCVYRPEREHKCGRLGSIASQKSLGRYIELHLRELSPPESLRLVTSLVQMERLPAAVKEQILERSHGNPFFVEEMIRSFIDQGLLYREGVFWQAREAIETVTVPESVQSVILSRVDRLRPDLKQLLQRASVIGRLFRRRMLEQIIGEAGVLEAALWELEEQALIYQERAVPEEEYSFKHVLTQETIYGSISRHQRAVLHQGTGEAIEALDREALDGYYEELAYHFERSDADEKAVEYLLKSGEKARRVYLNDEAVSYFRRALERLDGPMSGADREPRAPCQEWRLTALKGLGQTFHGMGRIAEAEGCFRQAIALGKEMDLPRRARVRLYYWLCYMLLWQCRYHEILAVAEEGLALLGDDVECVEAALMNATLAAAAIHRGDRERYREFNLRNAPFLLRLPYSEELRWAYANIAEVYVFDREKDVEKPMKWLRALEQMARQHHDARALGEVHARMGLNILETRGDLRGALARYEQGLELFTTIGDEKLGNNCQLCMAAALIGLGELEKAAEGARRALAVAERVGTPRDVARSHLRLGVISLCQGDWGSAIDAFQQMAQLYRSVGHPLEADAVLRLGHAYLAGGKQWEALRQFQEVICLAGSDVDRLVAALSGLEEAHEDPGEFRAFCHRLREQRPETDAAPLARWYLEPTRPFAFAESRDHDAFATSLSPQWAWQDPLGDCSFRVQYGLEIRAANGRDLWSVNLSAPRLLRSVSGGFAVQTVCLPVSGEQPALGGLLLWKDPENFLRLDRGAGGKYEISFRGCLGGEHVIPGRGRLPCERVFLRLERRNGRVSALCSADGQSWFTVGDVSFSIDDPVEVGLYATGLVFLARTLYPGAYPDGTAIRFEYFQEWTGERPHPG